MRCIYNRKWRVRLGREQPAQDPGSSDQKRGGRTGLSNGPILIYEQDAQGEPRYVYYCETDAGRLLAAIVIKRGERIRVVTAYDLDAGQKKDYLARRVRGD